MFFFSLLDFSFCITPFDPMSTYLCLQIYQPTYVYRLTYVYLLTYILIPIYLCVTSADPGAGIVVVFSNGPIPASFCLFSFFSNTNCTEKAVGFSRIRTRIVRVDGEQVDHLTTAPAPTSVKGTLLVNVLST